MQGSMQGLTQGPMQGLTQGLTKPDSPPRPLQKLPTGVTPGDSPSVRRLARRVGIDLRLVRGTARGGRMLLAEVRAHSWNSHAVADSDTDQSMEGIR